MRTRTQAYYSLSFLSQIRILVLRLFTAFLSGCGCFLWDAPDDVTFTSNLARETACHKEERSFGMTVKVCTNQFINAVIASPFWLIFLVCVTPLSISGGLNIFTWLKHVQFSSKCIRKIGLNNVRHLHLWLIEK